MYPEWNTNDLIHLILYVIDLKRPVFLGGVFKHLIKLFCEFLRLTLKGNDYFIETNHRHSKVLKVYLYIRFIGLHFYNAYLDLVDQSKSFKNAPQCRKRMRKLYVANWDLHNFEWLLPMPIVLEDLRWMWFTATRSSHHTLRWHRILHFIKITVHENYHLFVLMSLRTE